jgi:AAA family ATP:ADP antiporter
MKDRTLRLLNLKKTESPHVFDLLTVQFFIGIASALINVLAFSHFINKLYVHEIPQAYIVIAFALLIINVIYEKLEHALSAIQLLKIIMLFNATVLFVIWLGFFSGSEHTVVFILLVWTILIYMISGYAFWGLVSQLYNIRESKRIFTIVGSGDISSKLIGYLAAKPLMALFGINNLIWFAIGALVAGYLVFTQAAKKKRWKDINAKAHDSHSHAAHGHHEIPIAAAPSRDLISTVFKKELIFAISLLSLISYNVFNLVDYTFLTEVKGKYNNIESVGFFVAVFFAVGRFVALILKLIFSSRVIERLGIITCLFITPITLLFFSLMLLFFNDGSGYYTLYIFGFMTLLTEVLRSTMQEPVFFILFQPLKEKFRLKGHLISKGYMLPPSLLIVGLSLIIMHKIGVEISIMLVIKLLLVNLLLWGVIIFFLRNAYLKTLRDSIKKGVFNTDNNAHIKDAGTVDILLEKVKSGNSSETIYALQLLEDAQHPEIKNILEGQLHHPAMEVRYYVVEQLSNKTNSNMQLLRDMLATEKDENIRQKLFSVLTKKDVEFLTEVAHKVHEYDYPIRKVIITSLLNQKEFDLLHHGGKDLNSLIHSADPKERELAVQITMELKNVRFTGAINLLINDSDARVKRSAIIAACRLKIKQLLPHILGLLDNPADKYLALSGLLQYGDELFHHLQGLPQTELEHFKYEGIKLAGKIKGPHSTRFLLHNLKTKSIYTEHIIHSLWTKDFICEHNNDAELLNKLLNQFLKAGKQKIMDYVEVPAAIHQDGIKNAIVGEIRNDVISALKICALLHNKAEFNRILELIHHEENTRLYNAVEMLELVLPKKTARDLNYLFNYLFDPSLARKTGANADISHFYNKIVFEEAAIFRPLTRAYCIYSSWKEKQIPFLKMLKTHTEQEDHIIVSETRQFVLKDMGGL